MSSRPKMSVAVIGNGFVGGSLTTVLNERGIDVYAFDKSGKYAHGAKQACIHHGLDSFPESTQDLVQACEAKEGFSHVYFVCLPTPMLPDGAADLSIVESVLTQLSSISGKRIAVVKSTVPPGSVAAWNDKYAGTGLVVTFNPEFLREASALDDMRNQDRIILGGPRPWINDVKVIFEAAFPNVPIIKTSSTTAEMVKYVTNIHLAVKVSLANEFYQICKELDQRGKDIDYDKVIEYATLDKRLGMSHWKVPGPMPDDITGLPAYGFAGSCVPGNTLVALGDGSTMTIEDLQKHHQTENSIEIYSVDHTCKLIEKRSIRSIVKRQYTGNIYQFELDSGNVIYATPEHFFPIMKGEHLLVLMAKDIEPSDKMFTIVDGTLTMRSISSLTTSKYTGEVYNMHLQSKRSDAEDDLFWVGNGIVTHNCFIKDLNALMAMARDMGIDPKTMSGAWQKNLEVRPQRDWEKLVGRAVSEKK